MGDKAVWTDLTDDCWKIVTRMLNDTPVAELDILTATAEERDFETVAPVALYMREAIGKNQPEAALNRLHTIVIKYPMRAPRKLSAALRHAARGAPTFVQLLALQCCAGPTGAHDRHGDQRALGSHIRHLTLFARFRHCASVQLRIVPEDCMAILLIQQARRRCARVLRASALIGQPPGCDGPRVLAIRGAQTRRSAAESRSIG